MPAPRDDDYAPVGREPTLTRLGRPFRSERFFFCAAFILALLFASGALFDRLFIEWRNRSVSIIVEYRDVIGLSNQSGESSETILASLRERGVLGLTVSEFTGKDLASGMMPMSFTPLGAVDPRERSGIDMPLNWGAMMLDSADPILPPLMEYMRIRVPGTTKFVPGKKTLVVIPLAYSELLDSGLLPDLPALIFAEQNGMRTVFRPAPAAYANGERTAASIRWLKKRFPCLASILPAGNIVAGYPDLSPITNELTADGITVGQAEFVRQIGASSLMSLMQSHIISLHSLTRDEIISRRLSREQIVERMIRAVHERSIRLLLMRPYDLYSTDRLQPFLDDVAKVRSSLNSRGYSFAWPMPIPAFSSTFASAAAVALIFLTCISSYTRRYVGRNRTYVSYLAAIVFIVAAAVLSLLIWRVSLVSRLVGGLCAAFAATEAALWALDRYSRPFDGLIAGLLIILAAGVVIGAHYGTSSAMLRLTPFSGVRLTLLLPPVLLLAHDLKQRVHPESFLDVMKRPPLWGEIVLLGACVCAAVILAVRSGNSGYVPDWEISFRDLLERALWVRPRTKEFLIGYPCLIIYYSLARGEVAVRYREIFRLCSCIAYASAINTFCHFHTLLPLTLVRVVNGWWLGIVTGFVILVSVDFIFGPIWRKGGRELFK